MKPFRITKKAANRLLRLADFLETKVPPKQFRMERWRSGGGTIGECGTTACAAGWATVALPRIGLRLDGKWNPQIEWRDRYAFDAVAGAFGIPVRMALNLFSESESLAINAKPRQVAARIRAAVKRGRAHATAEKG